MLKKNIHYDLERKKLINNMKKIISPEIELRMLQAISFPMKQIKYEVTTSTLGTTNNYDAGKV